VRRVSLLPYHGTGAAKTHRLGRPETARGFAPPPVQHLEALARLVAARGLETTIGG
jgi:hypothetical protein